jgi:Helix-turn-helix domain
MHVHGPTPGASAALLTLTCPAGLIDQIADAVAERLSDADRNSPQSPWLDVPAAAAYLDMTSDAVCKAAQRGMLPAHQPVGPGSRYFFHRRELDDFIAGSACQHARGVGRAA